MATPYDAPIPGVASYGTAALGATTAYQNALARINQKRTSTLQQYGYMGDIDPTNGTVQNLRVDPNNRFGGLQQMLRSNADEVQQAQFAAEERGLHGGLAHKGISDAHYDLGNASQQLGSSFAGSLGGFQDEQNQAAYTRDQALYQSELDAARLAISDQNFNPADNSGVNYADPTDNGNPSGTTSPNTAAKLSPYLQAAAKAVAAARAKGQPIPYVHPEGAKTVASKVVANAKKKGRNLSG